MTNVLNNYFGIRKYGSTIPREITAGAVTFVSMVYILAVQPGIMASAGMDSGAVFTATTLSAGIATLTMALLGRVPIALASGLGINAYIAFSVCGPMGFSWQTALAAVFIEGLIVFGITLCGLREKIIRSIPDPIKKAVALGIGFFIAVIGFHNAEILTATGGTPLAMNPVTSGAPLLAVTGLVLPPAPYTPLDLIEGFKLVRLVDFLVVLFSLLFLDVFDTISTLSGIAIQGNLLDNDGNIINCKKALFSDAIGTIVGAIFGATTVTAFIESSTGVAAGGRTGFASVITALLFFLALFFSPVFLVIPKAATAPALIFVGFMMLGALSGMDLRKLDVGLPVFITMLIIPLSYSISQGLAWGLISWTIIKAAQGNFSHIQPGTLVLAVLFLVKQII